MPLAQLSASFQSLPPLPTSKLGPSGADSWGGLDCVHSRTLWFSPINSLVRLGVSPAVTTPTGIYSQRCEAFFSNARTLGCVVCLAPQLFLLAYLHVNVGSLSLSAATSSTLSASHCLVVYPRHLIFLSLPLLPIWMNISLTPCLLDFHTI